jgi:gliding motility-associated-like protein
MLNRTIFFVSILLSLSGYSQNNTFFRKYNLPGMQGALQIIPTSDGGFAATGQHESSSTGSGHGECDIYVYRLDVCGNILWFKLYGTNVQEGGKSLSQTADGGFIVSGLAGGQGFNLKIDQNGTLQWYKRYNVSWMMYAEETPTGDIVCLGQSNNVIYLMKTTSTGNIIWSKQFNGMGDHGLYLKNLTNGDIILTSSKASFGTDVVVGRFSSIGNPIWIKKYGGTGYSDADHTVWSNKGVIDEATGTMYVTSPTLAGGLGGENILVAKIDINNGNVIWGKAFGGVGRDQSRDIVKYPGGYAILGQTNSFPSSTNTATGITQSLNDLDILLVSFDSNGAIQWSRSYGGNERDKGVGLRFNNDNGFSISAFTSSSFFGNTDSSMDPLFIKTDSIGKVSCQMSSPTLSSVALSLTGVAVGSVTTFNASTSSPAIGTLNFTPNDGYLCQACTTVPVFTPSDTTVCVGDTVFFDNTTSIGLTCFQEWEINGDNFSGDTNPFYTWTTPGDKHVYLYSTCGAASDTFDIVIHVYQPQISAPPAVCIDNAPIQVTANIAGGIWAGSSITNTTTGMFNPSISSGIHPISYTIPQLCTVYDTIMVNVLPPVDAGPNVTRCGTYDSLIGTLAQAGISYSWNTNSNLNNQLIAQPQLTVTNNNNTNLLSALYILTATNTTTLCDDKDTIQIFINPIPLVNAGQDFAFCQFDPINLSASGAVTYNWSNAIPDGQDFYQTIDTVNYSVLGTNQYGCVDTDTIQVTMNYLPPIFAGNDTILCFNSPYLLDGAGGVSYVWNNGVQNLATFLPPLGNSSYIVTGTDIFGCVNKDTVVLTVFNNPTPSFSFTVDCYAHLVYFTNTTPSSSSLNPSANLSYSWDFGNASPLETTMNPTHLYPNAAGYSIELTATSSEGNCTQAITQTIPVPTIPTVDFQTLLSCDLKATFTGSITPSSTPIIVNNWSFGDSIYALNVNNSIAHTFGSPGVFNVAYEVTIDENCVYKITLPITLIANELLDDQIIPNIITANGDGINDTWNLDQQIDICLEYEVIVLNRWGNIVYKTAQFGDNFSGLNINGEALAEGVYFYVIEADSQKRIGNITISRN